MRNNREGAPARNLVGQGARCRDAGRRWQTLPLRGYLTRTRCRSALLAITRRG
jgi:hypothetical protein